MRGIQHSDRPNAPVSVVAAGDWTIEFLPARAYEVRYQAMRHFIGLALDPQMGIHAIGTDRRQGFRARVGMVGVVPAGCDVYSASEHGGDYLRLMATETVALPVIAGDHGNGSWLKAAISLRTELQSRKDPLNSEGLAWEIVARLSAISPTTQSTPTRGWITPLRMRRIEELIEARLDTTLLVRDIASELALSTPFFSRAFREATGRSPQEHIIQRRLQRAYGLVVASCASLAAVAAATGFSSQAHMTTLFGRRYGISPARLRREHGRTTAAPRRMSKALQ